MATTATIQGPVDGYGGSLYAVQFLVPVYNSTSHTYLTISWENIDSFYNLSATLVVTSAVSFTTCLVTLLNLIVLTPNLKRRTPLYMWMLAALLSHAAGNLVEVVMLLHSPLVSAYITLTLDFETSRYSLTYKVMVVWIQSCSCLSFICLQACFFLQGKSLLTWLRMHRHQTYLFIIIVLVLTGAIALCLRATFAVWMVTHWSSNPDAFSSVSKEIGKASVIVCAISIGLWSMIFFCSAMSILFSRRSLVVQRNSLYDTVLNLIAIIGIESFIIPIVLCILQLLAENSITLEALQKWRPEWVIGSAALFALPFAPMFASVRSSVVEEAKPRLAAQISMGNI